MIGTKIWDRYFISEVLKVFFLFLFGFYALYALLDYSSHSASFHRNHVRFNLTEVAFYYALQFVGKLDVLLPFALLIATIKTLCGLNIHRELVAFLAGGIHLKRLMRPFVFLGLLGTLFVYLNTELLLPAALQKIRKSSEARLNEKAQYKYAPAVKHLILEDGSTFLFHHYHARDGQFYDAFWVKNVDEIYRIKQLDPSASPPVGKYVEHLKRDSSENLTVENSYNVFSFSDMRFNQERLIETVTPVDELSLTKLWDKAHHYTNTELSEKESAALTAFYHKLAMPWLCLFAVIAPLPFCVRFTRNLPVFMIYACSIFGLVAFYIIMNAAMTLGDRQVVDPLLAIGTPFTIFAMIFGWNFTKLK